MKLKQLLAAALLFCTAGASAQTDVTSTYLTNADFSESTALTSDFLYGYGKDGAPYGFQDIDGWTPFILKSVSDEGFEGSAIAGGVFSYGSATALKGNNKPAPATNPAGEAAGNCFGFFSVWGCGGYYYQDVTLPAGNYTLTFPMYNQSGTQANTSYTGFFPTEGTAYTVAVNPAAGKWVDQSVSFQLTEETAGQIRIGYQSTGNGSGANPMLFIDCVKILGVTDLEMAQGQALATLPASAGDDFFTMGQTTIDEFTQRIKAATTVEAVNAIKDEITAWEAPALSGEWNIKNATAAGYLGVDGESVKLVEAPIAITFEKADNGFYIKAGEAYINMKGGNTWSMSASDTPSTAWTFALTDGKYTISGPNGMIGTDQTAIGSICYGNKKVENNGTWTISEAVGEDEAELIAAKNALQAALDAAPVPTENIGNAAFQYNSDDVAAYAEKVAAAQAVLDDASATKAELDAQTEIITALSLVLNAPEATQAYNLVFNCEGHTATGNALTLIPNPAQAQGLYGLKYLAPANQNLAQAFYFTHTEGNKYKIHAIDQDGNVRYITTQAEGYGTTWYDGIRTIEDAEKAMEVEIRPNGEGLYLLWNTGANKAIAHNGNTNNDMFTNNTANFQFVETQKPSITINTTATGGWGTVMLPFAATLPADVNAYCVSEIADYSLTLVAVNGALEANKPYIIGGIWDETLTDDAKGAALTYTEGLLTGVYTDTPAEAGWYVFQEQDGQIGFYQVEEGASTSVLANQVYVIAPDAGVTEFILDSIVTAIERVFNGLVNGKAYDLAGRNVQRLQKGGAYIINGTKVIVK